MTTLTSAYLIVIIQWLINPPTIKIRHLILLSLRLSKRKIFKQSSINYFQEIRAVCNRHSKRKTTSQNTLNFRALTLDPLRIILQRINPRRTSPRCLPWFTSLTLKIPQHFWTLMTDEFWPQSRVSSERDQTSMPVTP